MSEISIEQIRALSADLYNISFTRHLVKRLKERNIEPDDVVNVIRSGEIIEQYPDDYPFPSCLELGMTVGDKPLHVCISIGNGKIFVITAYYPSSDMWEDDFKTRKEL